MNAEQQDKFERVCSLLFEKNLDSIVLRSQPNVGWFIGGRANIAISLEWSCLALIVSKMGVRVITDVIEAPRLIAEELNAIGQVIALPWWESFDSHLPHGPLIGYDGGESDSVDISAEIQSIRLVLNEEEIIRIKSIATDTAQGLGAAMASLTGVESEVEVAGLISLQLWNRNLEPVVVLVAGEHRAPTLRHALPTIEPIRAKAVGSTCARRKGLIASATRIATFGAIADQYVQQYDRLLEVEASLLNETTIGTTYGAALVEGVSAYEDQGFPPDEWHQHHQGGPMGYLPRDFVATPKNMVVIATNHVVAWNPTATGWKVEDTWLVQDSGLELLTFDGHWPDRIIKDRLRPDLLRR
jgi:Xaa-Pro aminopeptidase